ncbi:MAG: thioredoxin [Micavibrio aeruginosavorus]|uniref:Thioredoxin n=1 Tax=Micavibrio aeruginosavorus TaxID=349221 RepID=A0A2W5FNK0_9BACT|nr:MAG: thioredoxin [Micavibrio aeruginosavorus]
MKENSVNSKIKFAGIGALAAIAVASPFVLDIQTKKSEAVAQTAAVAAQVASDSNFSAAQKTELEAMMKDFIMKNPKVLMDSVNGYREQEQKTQEDAAVQALKDNWDYLAKGTLPDVGPKTADITIVEFFDYNCGYCKQGYEAVQKGLDNDKNVRFVFVDFPILSESSHLASKYALAAQKQNKYFELHAELMKYKGPKTEESILNLAKSVGIDTAKLKADANSPDIEATIAKNTQLAQKLAISGTPAFIIGDQVIRGYIPYEGMKTMIDAERKKKG